MLWVSLCAFDNSHIGAARLSVLRQIKSNLSILVRLTVQTNALDLLLQRAGVGNCYDMVPDNITQMRQVASPLVISISHQNKQYRKTPRNRMSNKRRANLLKQSHAARPPSAHID